MRLCLRRPHGEYWGWVRHYPFEVSLVVVTATQTLALLSLFSGGASIWNHPVPAWVTLAVAGMFAVCAALIVAALIIGNPGIMATALRATLVAFLTLIGMVMPGGVNAAEAVTLAQVVPYIILTALRACYLESVWRAAGPVRTA